MDQLPPGIVYLISCLPQLLLPPAIVYSLNHICDFAFDLSLPAWLQIPAYVLSFPVLFTCSVLAENYRDRRQAVIHGAVLPPKFPSTWPGGLDTLLSLVQNFKTGYMGTHTNFTFPHRPLRIVGDFMEEQCGTLGHTFNMRVLFENRASAFFHTLAFVDLSQSTDLHSRTRIYKGKQSIGAL
jgi:hypothetical protein